MLRQPLELRRRVRAGQCDAIAGPVEQHAHVAPAGGEVLDLAPAVGEEPGQRAAQRAAQQQEHGLRLQAAVRFARYRERQLGVGLGRGGCQPLDQVTGQARRVAGHRHQPLGGGLCQPGQDASQWTGLAAQRVGQNRRAERGVGLEVAVGADPHRPDLRREPLDGVRGQRPAEKLGQALVDAAHAAAAPAGEHEPGDLFAGGHRAARPGRQSRSASGQTSTGSPAATAPRPCSSTTSTSAALRLLSIPAPCCASGRTTQRPSTVRS